LQTTEACQLGHINPRKESMHMTKFIKSAAATGTGFLCLLLITACGLKAGTAASGGIAGTLARLEPLVANCKGPINAYAGIDDSATGRGNPTLTAARLQAVRDLADQAAACGGYMKVVAFASTGAAEDFILGSTQFPTNSGTETTRLIAANKAESELLGEVEDNIPKAMHELHAAGTNVLAQLTLAQQFQEQRPGGKLYVELLTDGLNTTKPVVMDTPTFDEKAARSAAEHLPIPKLPGASVRIAGIGQMAGARPLSIGRINALTTFYELVCRRSGATDCLATTDYTPGG
jgi:hypothetical protein